MKIRFVTIFLTIVLSLLVGMALGIEVHKVIIKFRERDVSDIQSKRVEQKNVVGNIDNNEQIENNVDNNSAPNNPTKVVKYDGEKTHTHNAKTYKFNFINKSRLKEADGQVYDEYYTTIYLNDKEIGQFVYRENLKDFTDKNLTITSMKDRATTDTYVVLTVTARQASDEDVYAIIINDNYKVLDTVKLHEANTGITADEIYSHKFYDDGIVYLRTNGIIHPKATTTKEEVEFVAWSYRLVIYNGEVEHQLYKLYTEKQVKFSGR